jgi:ribose-phosphate pyrophosphokinase
MKTLHLVYPEKSEIKYKISRFPDGQQSITIDPETAKESHWKITNNKGEWEEKGPFHPARVTIHSRLNSWMDLEIIVCAVKALRLLGCNEVHLKVPYFLGSRSDRKFDEGSVNYLKHVICPIINSLQLTSIEVLDPHSDCLEMGLNGFKKVSNERLVKWALGMTNNSKMENVVLVSPDAGATKKIFKIAEAIGYKGDIITCSKERDANGNLTKCIFPAVDARNFNKDLVVIDDICDGGGTFINIVKAIDESNFVAYNSKIHLVVTHGIFSKGLKELSEYFDGIYTTNSYRDIDSNTEFGMHNEKYLHEVHQLNVF